MATFTAKYFIGVGHESPGYDTIAAWIAGTSVDLVSSGAVIIGELIHNQSVGTYDEDGLIVTGATTDNDNYRMLQPAASSIGQGKRGTGPLIFSNAGGSAAVLNVQEDGFRTKDIEIASDGLVPMYGVFTPSTFQNIHFSGVVIYDTPIAGFFVPSSGSATNCIVHHSAAANSQVGAFQGDVADNTKFIVRHCTALADSIFTSKSTTGFRYVIAQNCISANYGTSAGHACYLNLGGVSTNNISTDTSATNFGSSGINSIDIGLLFENTESGAPTNLHIKSNSVARGIASGILDVSIDIDRQMRPLVQIDIGADHWFAVGGVNVEEDDIDLVFLYRYEDFDTVEQLDNRSESVIYTGLNTMSTSGSLSKTSGPGIQASGSSGVISSGGVEIFHLPYSPAQSGNASGIHGSTTQDFSYGGWILFGGDDSPPQAFTDFMGKHSVGSGGFTLTAHSGSTGPEWAWRANIGTSNGAGTSNIRNVDLLQSGQWQHVVCTVDAGGGSDNIRMYVSGVLRQSGTITVSPAPSGSHPPLRLFSTSSKTSEIVSNSVAGRGGQMAETFLIRRTLSENEVLGVYNSGFTEASEAPPPAPNTGIIQSDLNDTLKDNLGALTVSASIIRMTAWDANEKANPSGFRHMISGQHPAWIKILGEGNGSGLNFGEINQSTSSGIKAITFRNITDNTTITNMRFWISDASAFTGEIGWEVAGHVNSLWLPNLSLPSGSGIIGKTLDSATGILQSDLGTTILGGTIDGTTPSGESGISQYIYLAFDTSPDFSARAYGPEGFVFRLTVDND